MVARAVSRHRAVAVNVTGVQRALSVGTQSSDGIATASVQSGWGSRAKFVTAMGETSTRGPRGTREGETSTADFRARNGLAFSESTGLMSDFVGPAAGLVMRSNRLAGPPSNPSVCLRRWRDAHAEEHHPIHRELVALDGMTVGELAEKLVFGEPSCLRNRPTCRRRSFGGSRSSPRGGLSSAREATHRRALRRTRLSGSVLRAKQGGLRSTRRRAIRGYRKPGTILKRVHGGREHAVTVNAEDFEFRDKKSGHEPRRSRRRSCRHELERAGLLRMCRSGRGGAMSDFRRTQMGHRFYQVTCGARRAAHLPQRARRGRSRWMDQDPREPSEGDRATKQR